MALNCIALLQPGYQVFTRRPAVVCVCCFAVVSIGLGLTRVAKPANQQSADRPLKTVKRIWRVGAQIQSTSRPVSSLLITFPIPTDWPEQDVNLYEEIVPDEVRKADFRDHESGLKQMVATIPRLPARKKIGIYVLLEITVTEIPLPQRTDHLVIPKRVSREIRQFLNPSPLINHRKIDIKKQVNELVDDSMTAWEQVQSFYEWIGANIEVKRNEKVVGAVATIKRRSAAPEDLSNLFIAMCRAHKVPARMVWADNGEYAEFYLEDDAGNGRWFPCVLEGKREFGSMTDPRVIIQKGDNIKVPEKKQRQRFVVEHVSGQGTGARPKVQFVRDLLPAR